LIITIGASLAAYIYYLSCLGELSGGISPYVYSSRLYSSADMPPNQCGGDFPAKVTLSSQNSFNTYFNTQYCYSFEYPKKSVLSSVSDYDTASVPVSATSENVHGAIEIDANDDMPTFSQWYVEQAFGDYSNVQPESLWDFSGYKAVISPSETDYAVNVPKEGIFLIYEYTNNPVSVKEFKSLKFY
jgi:hypothetical protein